MKRTLKYFLLVVLIAFVGCAGGQITDSQEDAIARSAGNTLGTALVLIKPEVRVVAKAYCQRFITTESMDEAGIMLEAGLTYLADKYTDHPELAFYVSNILKAIGWNQEEAERVIFAKGDELVKIKGFTKKSFRLAKQVVGGFCEVL